jgi:hypothetical protein
MPFTQDFRTQRRNYTDGQTRVGETGRLWYDSDSNTIRVGDGETAGGVIVGGGGGGSYTLPTASTTVKGGVKIDGQTIVIDNQQISVGLINYSSISNPPTLLSDFTNDVGFITSSALSGYATQTYVTTRGYITSYTETDPVFLAHPANNVTNTKISNWDTAYGWGNHASAGYLTTVGTISYNDLSNKPTLFSGSYTDLTNKPTIPTAVSQLTNDSGYLTTVSSLTNGSDTLSLNGANKVDLPGGTAYIWSAANNISLFPDLSGSNYLEIINNVGAILSTDRGFDIRTNADGTTRTWAFTQGGTLFFPDSTAQTTAYSTNAARALFSAANASASGSGGSLSYSSGVFTFTPALNIAGNAATVTNGVYTTDTGTVTNTMLAGSIANNKLANSSITINSTAVSLGGTITGVVTTGDTGTVTNTMLAGSIANNKLTNSSITVNGTSIALGASGTVTAAADTLTSSTLASGVTASSLTSVGTLNGLTINSTTGGNFFTISGLGRPANGNIQTWRFFSNTDVGGPGSYIEFPDGSLQNTAWTGTVSYNNVTDTPAIPDDLTDLGITDGTNGQVLTTDGSGGFSFQDATGGSGITAGDYVVRAAKNGSTVQTIPNGTDTVVTLVDDFDPQGWWTSNKFQPTIAGYYSMSAQIWWGAGSINNNQTNLQLRKNGNSQLAITQTPVNNSTVGEFLNLSTIAYFNGSTDYVEVTAYTANPTSQDINPSTAGTWFSAALYGYGSGPEASGSSSFSNEYVLTGTTSNATETEILVGGSTRIPVATNKSVNYIVNIAARRTDSAGDYAMFEIRGVAANSSGTVSDIGSVYEVVVARTNAGYLVDVRADDTNNSVNVYVTGVSGHTINWRAVVQTIEV